MGTLYIIRHAQGSFGTEKYDRLSELGVRQAKMLAEHFVRHDVQFESIYSGTLTRQIETANAYIKLAHEKNRQPPSLKQLEDLNEFDLGSVFAAMKPFLLKRFPQLEQDTENFRRDRRAFRVVIKEIIQLWTSESYDFPGVPTWKDFSLKVNKVLNEIALNTSPSKDAAIFTSGGVILAALRGASNIGEFNFSEVENIPNTSVNQFKMLKSKLSISSQNDLAHLDVHLEPELKTYI